MTWYNKWNSGGTASQILTSVRIEGGLESICSSLNHSNTEIVYNMLEGLHKVLDTVAKW